MNRSTGLEGVHGTTNAFDLERARQPDRPDFSMAMRGKMRWPHVLMDVFPLPLGMEREDRCE